MNEKKMKDFIDRLDRGEGMNSPEHEEQEMAMLWNDLGAMRETIEVKKELVSEFQDKLTSYQHGWEEALATNQSEPTFEKSVRSPIWSVLSYVMVAGAAAVFVLVGFATHSYFDKTDSLQAELKATREMLAISLLEQPSAPKRLAGLVTASKVAEPSESLRQSMVRTFDTDTNVNVRLAAVSALQSLPREDLLAVLLDRLEHEESILVQSEILRFMLLLMGDNPSEDLVRQLENTPAAQRVKSHLDTKNQTF